MGGIFKQYGWIFDLVAILLCSFFLAKIVSVYVGRSLEVQRSVAVLKKGGVTEEAAPPEIPQADYRIIVDRDIFDASEAPPTEVAEGTAEAGEAMVPGGEAVKTSLPIKVWAVLVVGEGRDKRSSATVEGTEGAKIDVYAVNQQPSFAPGTQLVRVTPSRIEFVNSGRLEYAELVNEAGASIFAPPKEGVPEVAMVEPQAPAAAPLVREEGAGKFTIDQAEVTNALGNIDQLYTEIRAVPSFEGGKMSGMKILSVKRGSVFDKLGLRRGDVLQRINGLELDVRRGFEIFNQLKDAKSLTVDLIRQGQPRTFEYEIR